MASILDDPEVMSTATPDSLANTYAQNRDVLRSQYPEQAAVLDNSAPLATPAPQSAAEAIKQAQTQFQAQAQQEQQQIAGQRAQLAEMVKGVLDQYKDGAEKGKWGVKILDDTIGKGGMGISPAKAALFAVGTVLGAQQRNGSGLATGMKLMQLPDQWEKQKSDMAHQVIQDAMGSLNLQSNLDTRQEALTTKQTGNWAKSLTQILAQRTGPGKEFATVDDWPEEFKAIAIQSGTMRPEQFQKRDQLDTTHGISYVRDPSAPGGWRATPIQGTESLGQAKTMPTNEAGLLADLTKLTQGQPVPKYYGTDDPQKAREIITNSLAPMRQKEKQAQANAEAAAERLKLSNEKAKQIPGIEFRALEDLKTGYRTMNTLTTSFEKAMGSTKGQVPPAAVAMARAYNTQDSLPGFLTSWWTQPQIKQLSEKLTPEWREHMSTWMRTLANVKGLVGMGRPALQEWQKALLAAGSVVEGPDMFRSNLAAAQQKATDEYQGRVNDLTRMYPMAADRLPGINGQPSQPSQPAQAPVMAPPPSGSIKVK